MSGFPSHGAAEVGGPDWFRLLCLPPGAQRPAVLTLRERSCQLAAPSCHQTRDRISRTRRAMASLEPLMPWANESRSVHADPCEGRPCDADSLCDDQVEQVNRLDNLFDQSTANRSGPSVGHLGLLAGRSRSLTFSPDNEICGEMEALSSVSSLQTANWLMALLCRWIRSSFGHHEDARCGALGAPL